MIEVGQDAPDFTLPGIENGAKRDYTLSEYRGRKVVLAFYPGDNTPGCTRQMCSYRDNLGDLEATGAVLLGISPQAVASHAAWAHPCSPFAAPSSWSTPRARSPSPTASSSAPPSSPSTNSFRSCRSCRS